MESGEVLLTAGRLSRFAVYLTYFVIGLISYLRIIPRLSRSSRRLAHVMFAAQILVIIVSIRLQSSSFWNSVWNLDLEFNIPSTLASTQLALVGGVALLTVVLARARPTWLRLYFFRTQPGFLYSGVG